MRPSLQALRSSPRFAPHVAGLGGLLAAAALDGNARRVGFSAQTLPEVKALRKDFKNDPRQQQTLPPYQLRLGDRRQHLEDFHMSQGFPKKIYPYHLLILAEIKTLCG
jgi:hypothetical protein